MRRFSLLLIASGLAAGCAPSDQEVNDNLPRAPEGYVETPAPGGGGGGGGPGMTADAIPSNYPGKSAYNKANEPEEPKAEGEATPEPDPAPAPEGGSATPEPSAPADPAPAPESATPEPAAGEPKADPAANP